jgi:predicted nucleotidyltransferase
MMVIFQLKNELLKNPNSRKIFGKVEIDIIIKQINGITLTQSERNRLSRDIRPKLEFIKKISLFKNEFDIKRNSLNEHLINNAKKIILNDPLSKQINAILLFGSIVEGNFSLNSDIDMCVVFKENISLKESTLFRIRILGEVNSKIDISVFHNLPNKIKNAIIKNHKVIFKRSTFDNLNFTINGIKDNDYLIRYKKIFGEFK